MEHWYAAHGLLVASALELPLPPGEPTAHPPDLTLRLGPERPVPAERPAGEQLAEVPGRDSGFFYSFARACPHTVLRYPQLCDLHGDGELLEVTAYPHPGVNPDLIGVLAAGALLAVRLMLHGRLVLHASAVRHDGHALAFVGASGMGKSTLAAALCGDGCDLIADDVLRVDLDDAGTPLVYPGSTANRLRLSARELADGAPPAAVRPTADGRLALTPGTRVDGPLPLAACVVPLPSRTAAAVSVQRLPAGRALRRMLQFPRVAGWREPASLDRTFQALADLIQAVPVYEAVVPWGPPFPPRVLADLLRAVG